MLGFNQILYFMTSVNTPEAFLLRDIFWKFAELVWNLKKYMRPAWIFLHFAYRVLSLCFSWIFMGPMQNKKLFGICLWLTSISFHKHNTYRYLSISSHDKLLFRSVFKVEKKKQIFDYPKLQNFERLFSQLHWLDSNICCARACCYYHGKIMWSL